MMIGMVLSDEAVIQIIADSLRQSEINFGDDGAHISNAAAIFRDLSKAGYTVTKDEQDEQDD